MHSWLVISAQTSLQSSIFVRKSLKKSIKAPFSSLRKIIQALPHLFSFVFLRSSQYLYICMCTSLLSSFDTRISVVTKLNLYDIHQWMTSYTITEVESSIPEGLINI